MSYAIPIVRLSGLGSGPQMKFILKLHCGSRSAYHCKALIKHNEIYLPPPLARTTPLPPALGGDAAGAGFCPRTPPRPAPGPARRRGPLAGVPPAYGASWEC